MKNYKFLLFTLFVGAILVSCQKEVNDNVAPDPGTGIENLNISPDFDWSTTSEYEVQFSAYANSLVTITTTDGKMLKVAMLSNETPTTVRFSAPTYVKKVKLDYLGNEAELELSDNELEFIFK